jgi:succinate dehydrogenase / fumarate reductase, iron-sulfur subunit
VILTLKVWRQESADAKGKIETFITPEISEHMSFLEMLDVVNDSLERDGKEPIAFDSDCREGICGTCSMMIDGQAHGPWYGTTVCQLHMREFKDGDIIVIEPWRARAFPVIRDLIVDRSAYDRIVQAGGYISVGTGGVPDANAIPIAKHDSDASMDAASCIGCGACVASCKNASAMLFVSARINQLARLPQGQPERNKRVKSLVAQMDVEGFGNCTNLYECEAACPKEIKITNIALLNRDFLRASILDD